MKRPDNMKQLLLKGVGSSLVLHPGGRVIKYALFAAASRTHVPAGIAADTFAQLSLPEMKALVRCHRFQLRHFFKAGRIRIFPLLANQFVEIRDVLTLAGSAFSQKGILLCNDLFAVQGMDVQHFLSFHSQKTFTTGSAQRFSIALAITLNAHSIDILPVDSVLLLKLDKRKAVAGLQKYGNFSFLFALCNQVLGKIGTGKNIINKVLLHFLRGYKNAGSQIVEEFAGSPAQYPLNHSRAKKLQRLFLYSLHLKSSSFLFSPMAVMVFTKSFMVAANFTPSAAETHSTRVRSRSMPKNSSIENKSVILLRA